MLAPAPPSVLDTVFGLPTHILVVHAVVVLLPLTALAAIAVALRPAWRYRFALPVTAAAGAMTVLAYLARASGQAFYQRLGEPAVADEHTALGTTLVWFALAMFVATLLLALLARQAASGAAVLLVSVLVVASAGVAAWRTVLVGHSGTQAVWGDIVENTSDP